MIKIRSRTMERKRKGGTDNDGSIGRIVDLRSRTIVAISPERDRRVYLIGEKKIISKKKKSSVGRLEKARKLRKFLSLS